MLAGLLRAPKPVLPTSVKHGNLVWLLNLRKVNREVNPKSCKFERLEEANAAL